MPSKGRRHYRWNNEALLSSHGYRKLRVGRSHPLADPNGYAYEHALVWFSANGKVPHGFVIHHKNEDKSDNRLENLEVMKRGNHNSIHLRDMDIDSETGRFVGKHAAGRLLDGVEHNAFPA